MIITLTGENNLTLTAQLRDLVSTFVSDHSDLALERLDGDEAEFNRISEALTGLPFLASKKMVVLKSACKNKQFIENFEQLIKNLPETTDLILVEPKLDKRLAYYKFLKKNTDFREFNELDLNGLSRWLSEAAKEKDGTLSASDARYLAERVGLNQQILSNELDKLLLYDSKISRRTIDLLTEPTPQSTIFQLLEAAFAGQAAKTLRLYGEQRALKVEPQQIVAMLAWQLHAMATIKSAGDRTTDQVAKEARLNPFVVRKTQGLTSKLNLGDIKRLIAELLAIDGASKRTAIDIDEALQNYLLKLAI